MPCTAARRSGGDVLLSLHPWSGCKKLEPCTDHPGGSIFPPPRCGCSWAFASPLVWCVAEPSGRLSGAPSSCQGMLGSTAVLGAVGWHHLCSLRVPEGHVGRGTGLLQPLGKERCRGGWMPLLFSLILDCAIFVVVPVPYLIPPLNRFHICYAVSACGV